MMIVVVPMFQDVFARFGNELPYLTQLIINISNAITKKDIGGVFDIYYLNLSIYWEDFFITFI